ncbi:MAG TPA: 50S ribosomal protein L32e [Candidatus Thermoplasmatota archaeon]|nr:50S ribosomal protein L32e [Candidatus Thermoplasmatota archaeon]
MAKDEKRAEEAEAPPKKGKPKAGKAQAPAPSGGDKARKSDELKLASKADEESEADAREGQDEAEGEAPKAGKGEGARKPRAEGKAKRAPKAPERKGRPRPTLDALTTEALKQRKAKDAQRPEFHRQEWFRYQRLGDKWRAPQGIQSKMRRHWGTHADVVSIGYRGPKAARGLHPSGFSEVLIHNAGGLEGLDPAREAVRIAGSVGRRKRQEIQDGAKKLGIRVLNWRQL